MVKLTFKTRESNDWCIYPTESRNVQTILLLVSSLLFVSSLGTFVDDANEFDNLVFSQRWLPSSCTEYEEKNPRSTNECVLPDNYQFWAVHGLWPNRNHGSLGPFFCNKSDNFRVDELKPIEPELRQYWPNIEKGKALNSLWKHEWLKHGTCAMKVPQLSTEFDYFNTSLTLLREFDVTRILVLNKVKPSDNIGYNVLDIIHIVKESFGKVPHISCITEMISKKAYLSEIRLCFDKSLQLIDCTGTVSAGMENKKTGFSSHLTNCPLNELIVYPNTAYSPDTEDSVIRKSRETWERYEKLLFLLQVIRFLM